MFRQPESPDCNRTDLSEGVEKGVWRYAKVERASVIIDAADYFALMQEAMSNARKRIILVGWDFDTRIRLAHGRRWWQRPFRKSYPARLGSFVSWLVRHRKGLELRILEWRVSVANYLFRGTMVLDLLRWLRHRRIHFKLDNAHPIGCSHHQKLAILDQKLAVCGGIDMTDKRWDTREHKEFDPRRRGVGRSVHGPWHDMTMMMEGEIAGALSEIAHDRWYRAGGEELPIIAPAVGSLWPESLKPQFENIEMGIARTRACHRDWTQVREVEELFLRHVRQARHFIYAESQYFASRAVCGAIAERLQEDDPPEIVVVHPSHADGWLEQQAMDHARARLVRFIEAEDKLDRFSIWMPYVGDTAIYVHAKLMIIDDRVLRIGSANLNNRSLGLDSECDVFIDADRPGNEHAAEPIAAIRKSLLAEHCAVEEDAVSDFLNHHGSMRAMIEATGDRDGRHLRRYRPPELSGVAVALAESELLDPESPQEMFEPFAKRGLFRKGDRLTRLRERARTWRRKRK